jgi:hypothetical protein
LLALIALAAVGCAVFERAGQSWWELSREPSGQAPDPTVTREAVLQVYAARAASWRGVFASARGVGRADATPTRAARVMGWGVDRGSRRSA